MIPTLQPFIGIGIFEFGISIDQYVDQFEFTLYPKMDENDCNKYVIDQPKLSLWVDDNNRIEAINCQEECLYNGRNLIGMGIDDSISHTSEQFYGEVDQLNYEEDNIPYFIYEFESLGLQVWCKNECVHTIVASPRLED